MASRNRLRLSDKKFANAGDYVILRFAVHFGVDGQREDLFAEAFGVGQSKARFGLFLESGLFVKRNGGNRSSTECRVRPGMRLARRVCRRRSATCIDEKHASIAVRERVS